MQPIVSIIIPVYNAERYLKKCLDSVINQTLRDIEIICVNDGSEDSSLDILQEYAACDARVVIIDQANGGTAKARNAGIAVAKGLYLGFVDSDDWIEPETYEVAIKLMIDDVDLVFWDIKYIYNDDLNMQIRLQTRTSSRKDVFQGKICLSRDFIHNISHGLCDKLFRNSIVKDNNIFAPSGIRYEDAWFLFKYFLHVRYIYGINNRFYNYNLNESSFTITRFKLQSYERLTGLYDVYLYYKYHGKETAFRAYYSDLFFKFFKYSYRHLIEQRPEILENASCLAEIMALTGTESALQLKYLIGKNYSKLKIVRKFRPSFWKRIWHNKCL